MKLIHLSWVLLAASTLQAQTTANPGTTAPTLPAPTSYAVVSRDANSALWQQTTYEQAPDGSIVPHIHGYTELSTGLNHLVNGQWVASKEEIDISPDGSSASATNGQAQAYFPGDIYSGVIKLVEPDGQVMQSQPIGLAYFDGTNSVLLAVVTNSTGAILPSGNEVIYTNALAGFVNASLVYRYTKAGFSQDVVLQQQPPDPSSLGLNPATTRLQMLTEFITTPQPSVTAMTVPTDAGNLEDDYLSFGAMGMGQGKTFLVGNSSPVVSVEKRWLVVEGRQFLIEEVPIVSIATAIDTLPPFVAKVDVRTKPVASKNLVLPPQRLTQAPEKARFLAKAPMPSRGLVLDYQTINTTQTNYIFQGNTTYYISGNVALLGTNTFEGGAVIKITNNANLNLTIGSIPLLIKWLASPYRPVVFTAKDDDTIGESISGSTGNPTNYYAATALAMVAPSVTPTISNFRITYAAQAMSLVGTSPVLSDGQIVNCQNGIGTSGSSGSLRNMLFANVQTNFANLQGGTLQAQNVTFNGSHYLETGPSAGAGVNYTNCIFANITNLTNNAAMGLAGDHNGFFNCPEFGSDTTTNPAPPFQTVGGGSYYLASGCAFTNQGTANINPTLSADLQTRTTHPPVAYTNVTFTNSLVFSPQAPRDTNALPDLGYHYDPIDYSFGGCIANSNMTFTAGTVVGWFRTSSGWRYAGYGIHMGTGVTVSFNGTATAPACWVRLNTVQEQDLTAGYGPGGIESQTNVNSPTLIGHFMYCSMVGYEGASRHFSDDYGNIIGRLTDSEFQGGSLGVYQDYMYYTNCLMWRVGTWLLNGTTTSSYTLRNCTFFGGQFLIQRNSAGPTPVSVRDCSFDGTSISTSDYWSTNTSLTDYDYNAYTNGTDPFAIGGTHDVIMTNGFNWQTSWFGNYYQPANSPLLNAGDVLASQQGLYHFTILTNQVPEGTNTVSIGYHYVATDAYGNPLDSNGDGIPDYLEDANGNGIYDSGDLGDWQGLNLNVIITQPRNGSILP